MRTEPGWSVLVARGMSRCLLCLAVLAMLALAAVSCGGVTDAGSSAGNPSPGAGGTSVAGAGGSTGTGASAGQNGKGGGSAGTAGKGGAAAGGSSGGSQGGSAGSGAGGSSTGGAAAVTGLTVSPALVTIALGTSSSLVATASFADGTKADVSAQATWSSSAAAIAPVAAGKVTGASSGKATISAAFSGASGSAMVVVSAVTATSLSLDPATVALPTGGSKQLTATLHLSDGSTQDATTVAAWSSDAAAVASVSSGGLVQGVSAGAATVTAATAGFTASAKVTVSGASLASLQLSPAAPIVPVGATLTFTALGVFSDGTTSDVTASASFGSGNGSLLSVDGTGHAKSLAQGSTTVTATVGAITGSTTVTITGATLSSVTVSPAKASMAVGHTASFTALASYSDGTKVDVTQTADWSSSAASVASVGTGVAGGQVTGLATGAATLTATSAGVSGTATVAVIDAKLVALAIAPPTFSVAKGGSVQLTVAGTYDDGSVTDETANAVWSSSADSVIGVNGGLATGVAEGTATLTASLAGISATAAGTVTAAVPTSVIIDPSSLTLAIAKKQAVTLSAVLSDGTTLDVTASATWSSSAPSVATVSDAAGAKGLVAAVASGSAVVTATSSGMSATCAVTVGAATMTSLSIAPINPSVLVGATVNFSATAIFSDGTQQNVTTMAAWTSSDTSVATLTKGGMGMGGGGPGGGERAHGIAAGTSTITATFMGFTAATTLTVTSATLVSISVSPVDATYVVGATAPYQAVAIFSDGTSQNIFQQCTWTSSDPSVAAITTGMGGGGPGGGMSGLLTAVGGGTATISCTYMGLSGSTPVTVNAATLTSVVVSPGAVTGALGSAQSFSAAAIYSDGTSADVTQQSTWQSNDTTVAQVSTAMMSKGQAKAIGPGVAQISATYKGVTGSASYTVTAAKLNSLVISPANASTSVGVSTQLTVEAIFSDGSSTDVTGAATWVSSDPTIAAVSDSMQRGRVTPVAPGMVTITATYQGVSATTSFTVKGATLMLVQVTPFDPTIPLGYATAFQATGVYDDNSTADLTGLVTWTSSAPSVATVSTSGATRGTVTPVSAGTAVISASYQGKTGTSQATITAAKLVSLSIAPNPIALSVGQTVALAATGLFDDGSSLDVTSYVTWLSSATSVANVSNAAVTRGHVKGLAVGTAMITASRGAVSAGAEADVKLGGGGSASEAGRTPTPTRTPTPIPTPTPTRIPTPIPTPTPTRRPTPMPTRTRTPTPRGGGVGAGLARCRARAVTLGAGRRPLVPALHGIFPPSDASGRDRRVTCARSGRFHPWTITYMLVHLPPFGMPCSRTTRRRWASFSSWRLSQ